MRRKPVRLGNALRCLSSSADAQGFVQYPCVVLQSKGVPDGSVLIKKLVAMSWVEIRDMTDSGRITLIKILPSPQAPIVCEQTEIASVVRVGHDSVLPRQPMPVDIQAPTATKKLFKKNPRENTEYVETPEETLKPILTKKHGKNRVVVFIDLENLFIELQKNGQELDIHKLQNVCSNYASLVQFWNFVSLGTYQRDEYPFSKIIDSGIPITLVKNGVNSVDSLVFELVQKALKNDCADTFIIGTHDGGPHYQKAVDEIKKHNKVFKLLTVSSASSGYLRSQSNNGCISAAPHDVQKAEFNACVRNWTTCGYLKTNTPNGQFIKEVISTLHKILPYGNSIRFYQLVRLVWGNLNCTTQIEFRSIDCEHVLSGLHAIAGILKHTSKIVNGKKTEPLYLDRKNPLLACMAL